MKLYTLHLLLCLLSLPACGQNQLTTGQKEADFDYLYEILAGNYPYFGVCQRQTGTDWLSNKEQYTARLVKTPTDQAYLAELESILAELGCKHIDLSPTRHWNKFRDVYAEVSRYNPSYRHWADILNQCAGKTSYWNSLLANNNLIPAAYHEPPYALPATHYRDSITPDGRIGIMRIASFEVRHLEADFHRIENFLNHITDAEYLIIDLQGNKGGTTQYWIKNLVNRLIQLPIASQPNLTIKTGSHNRRFYPWYCNAGTTLTKNERLPRIPAEFLDGSYLHIHESTMIYPFHPIPFGGSIILLIDGQTSSAADEFAVFCKSTGWATVAGETSAGGGIGGDPALIQLPGSGIIVRYPALTGFNPDGSINMEACTAPNVPVRGASADERLANTIRLVLTKP